MTTIKELDQLAFEHGQPAENGDGYLFTQEQFEEFAEAVIASFAPIIENLNDRHDLGVQERDRLRSLLSARESLKMENQRITPICQQPQAHPARCGCED